jgi:CRP-like cAMP-binding protein
VRSLRAGAAAHGDEPPGLCGIASGAVCLRLESAGSHVLDYLPAGSWWLDPSVFADGAPLVRLEVHRRATVARLPRAALRELLRRHPEAVSALQGLGYSGVRRVTGVLQELAALPLRARLARCILRLADNFGRAEGDALRIALPIRQDAIAHMLHASRQRVNIELKALEAAGVLQVEKELRVLDRAALVCASRPGKQG